MKILPMRAVLRFQHRLPWQGLACDSPFSFSFYNSFFLIIIMKEGMIRFAIRYVCFVQIGYACVKCTKLTLGYSKVFSICLLNTDLTKSYSNFEIHKATWGLQRAL